MLPEDARLTSEIRCGEVVKVTLAAATALRPQLIVIGAASANGASGVSIADSLSVPVLIARRPTSGEAIVVASDAKSEAMPVLGAARRILNARGGSITLFHAARGGSGRTRMSWSTGRGFDRFTCARFLALQHLASDEEVRILVGEADDRADAITQVADDTRADVVAVGYRQQPSVGCSRRRTTREVIDRCSCSVLVVPMARDPEME